MSVYPRKMDQKSDKIKGSNLRNVTRAHNMFQNATHAQSVSLLQSSEMCEIEIKICQKLKFIQ